MIKSLVTFSVLLATVFASDINDFEINLIDYDNSLPSLQSIIYPPANNFALEPAYNPYEPEPVLLPPVEVKEIVVKKTGLIATVITFALSLIKKATLFLLFNLPALALGTLAALGLCKFTSLCKICDAKSLLEAKTELLSFVDSETFSKAADFVKDAIAKYELLQEQ